MANYTIELETKRQAELLLSAIEWRVSDLKKRTQLDGDPDIERELRVTEDLYTNLRFQIRGAQ